MRIQIDPKFKDLRIYRKQSLLELTNLLFVNYVMSSRFLVGGFMNIYQSLFMYQQCNQQVFWRSLSDQIIQTHIQKNLETKIFIFIDKQAQLLTMGQKISLDLILEKVFGYTDKFEEFKVIKFNQIVKNRMKKSKKIKVKKNIKLIIYIRSLRIALYIYNYYNYQIKNYLMMLPTAFFLYAFIYLITPSNVACDDKYCRQCGYDSQDFQQSCISCNFPWSVSSTCNKMPCNSCNPQYYNFSIIMNQCQLNQVMTAIVTASVLIFTLLIICICYYCYQQKQREEQMRIIQNREQMRVIQNSEQIRATQNREQIRVIQNRNNLILAIINKSKNIESNNLKKKNDEKQRIGDQKYECSICLQDNCEVISKCGHLFHAPRLYLWMKNKNSCPNCNFPMINIVSIISCLGCRTQTKQYDILQFNKESIYKIEHQICNNCQFRPIDTEEELNHKKDVQS